MTETEWIAFLQRPEIPAFNRAMLDNPDDDLPRLVFADWLDENCPDTAVNRAVRESVTNHVECGSLAKFIVLNRASVAVSLFRGRIALQVLGAASPPDDRSRRECFKALCRSGWIGFLHLAYQNEETFQSWCRSACMIDVESLTIERCSRVLDYMVRCERLMGLKQLVFVDGLSNADASRIANSPYLCEAIRAQWRRPTDEGGT